MAFTVSVGNNASSGRRVTVRVAGFGHDLDGTPLFLTPPAGIALDTGTAPLELAAGERRPVQVTADVPSDPPSLYAAVVAESAPDGAGAAVSVRTQVATLVLLRGRRPWRETAAVEDVQIRPGPAGGPATIVAVVRDTGNVHVRPTGTATIEQCGRTLATVPLTGETILPSFARRLRASWTPPPGLTGPVTVRVRTTGPTAEGTGTVAFRAGVPAFAAAEIRDLQATRGARPAVSATVANTGTVDVAAQVRFTASAAGVERGRSEQAPGTIAVAGSRPLRWEPRLPDGRYLVRLQVLDQGRVLAESVTGLLVGTGGDPPAGQSGGGVAAAAVVAAVLLVAIAVALIRAGRRRRGPAAGAP